MSEKSVGQVAAEQYFRLRDPGTVPPRTIGVSLFELAQLIERVLAETPCPECEKCTALYRQLQGKIAVVADDVHCYTAQGHRIAADAMREQLAAFNTVRAWFRELGLAPEEGGNGKAKT